MTRRMPSSPVTSFRWRSSSSPPLSDWTVVSMKSSSFTEAQWYAIATMERRGQSAEGRRIRPALFCLCALPSALGSELRGDQAEVVVPALVDHRDLVAVDVPEDDELVLRVVQP